MNGSVAVVDVVFVTILASTPLRNVLSLRCDLGFCSI